MADRSDKRKGERKNLSPVEINKKEYGCIRKNERVLKQQRRPTTLLFFATQYIVDDEQSSTTRQHNAPMQTWRVRVSINFKARPPQFIDLFLSTSYTSAMELIDSGSELTRLVTSVIKSHHFTCLDVLQSNTV